MSVGKLQGWAGVITTALIAVVAFSVQWGVVTTKLELVVERLNVVAQEVRSYSTEQARIDKRLSRLEGVVRGAKESS